MCSGEIQAPRALAMESLRVKDALCDDNTDDVF